METLLAMLTVSVFVWAGLCMIYGIVNIKRYVAIRLLESAGRDHDRQRELEIKLHLQLHKGDRQ